MGPRDHNKGQTDGSHGHADPPYSILQEIFGNSSDNAEGAQRNADYWDGYNHAIDQADD